MFSRLIKFTIHVWIRFRTLFYTSIISPLFAQRGSRSRISPPFRFAHLQQVKVGNGVIINRDCWIGVVSDPDDEVVVKLTIGDGAAIGMGSTISAALSVTIEEDVLLARNVYISDHSHAFEDITRPIKDQGITGASPVRIGRGTWLGQNAVVLPGVDIGEHCVIGANAVVRTSIPAFSVAVGVPARIVRRYDRDEAKWIKF